MGVRLYVCLERSDAGKSGSFAARLTEGCGSWGGGKFSDWRY